MASSSFTCVKTSDLDAIRQAAQAYKKMSNVQVITQAAMTAGRHLSTAMSKTIKGDPSLKNYHDVADSLGVWEAENPHNVHVGIPESHALAEKAQQMHEVYPVKDAVVDLTQQQGDTEAAFLDALAGMVSR
jgi:hypothetical protein